MGWLAMSWPGLDWVLTLQRLSPALDGVMRALSFFGDEVFFSAFVPFLYWCVDTALGLRVLAILVSSDFVNGVVKWAVHAPRPFWVDAQVKALSLESAYGLPSGHAQNAAAIWPTLARVVRGQWAMIAAVLLILSISISRMYLGVHFPQDVVAGWVIGTAIIVVYRRVEPGAVRWFGSRPLSVQILAALGVSMLMLVVTLGVRATIAGISDPPVWSSQATTGLSPADAKRAYDPRSLDGPVASVGVVFGAGVGLALMRRSARFSPGGAWRTRAARLVIGLLIVAVLRFGLAAVFPRDPVVVGLALRYVRYALLALGVVWVAPWFFIKIGLAERRL